MKRDPVKKLMSKFIIIMNGKVVHPKKTTKVRTDNRFPTELL